MGKGEIVLALQRIGRAPCNQRDGSGRTSSGVNRVNDLGGACEVDYLANALSGQIRLDQQRHGAGENLSLEVITVVQEIHLSGTTFQALLVVVEPVRLD